MNDWKGNEIKVGHTIALVQVTKVYPNGGTVDYFKKPDVIIQSTTRQERMWRVLRRFEIVEGPGMEINYESISKLPIDIISVAMPSNFEILVIEGLSDDKEEYYRQKS